MRRFILVCLLLIPSVVWGQSDVDSPLNRLRTALNAVLQEQQAVYQQFQMIQTLSEQMQQGQYAPPTAAAGTFPNYDDMVRDREYREEKVKDYAAELERLYERYRQLGERSAVLTDQIQALALSGGSEGRR